MKLLRRDGKTQELTPPIRQQTDDCCSELRAFVVPLFDAFAVLVPFEREQDAEEFARQSIATDRAKQRKPKGKAKVKYDDEQGPE